MVCLPWVTFFKTAVTYKCPLSLADKVGQFTMAFISNKACDFINTNSPVENYKNVAFFPSCATDGFVITSIILSMT
jgi:hypothetical protein